MLKEFYAFITTFFAIAIAELGDKTQLLTLGYAALYPLWEVISAVSFSTAILMAMAVIFGKIINQYVPPNYVQLFSGIFFIIFGIWNLKKEDDEKIENKKTEKNIFWFIFFSFFVAELGDRTQLATFTFSAEYKNTFLVWLAATSGLIFVNISGILAGSWIKKYISEMHIKIAGSMIFIIFGIIALIKFASR